VKHRTEEVSYTRLRSAIACGELLPNERLVEHDLASSLKVGRTAIRMALARLAQENIVERLPNRGARVRRISEREAVEILEVRTALEAVAARHAAARATDADVAALHAAIEAMRRGVDKGDALVYTETNKAFHQEVLRIADHLTTAGIIETLRSRYAQYQFRQVEQPRDSATRIAQHQAIADAIARHDADGAEHDMRDHLTDVLPGVRAQARR